ncbi:hypothetical protein ACFX2I_002027 [Malus domestica]|uniref:Uncharacterized protein n=1 Tax=Malus domestica TaxID=3750 RepID=A0A498KLK6_MALDO|nr:hypothetical protein DVH24_022500 [Malus domestica]
MPDFPGKMSSESEDKGRLPHSESDAQDLAKHSRITYSRDILFSLANVDASIKLPSGIESSILSELYSVCPRSSQPSRDSEYRGLLGNGHELGVYGRFPGDSASMLQNSPHLLHKSKEPYRPRQLYKAVNRLGTNPWNSYNDDTLGSSECLSQKEEEEGNITREAHEKAVQEKQTQNSNEHDETSKFGLSLEDSTNSTRNKCETSEEHVVSPASPVNSSNSASQQTPVSGQELSPGLLAISVDEDTEAKFLIDSIIPEHSDLTTIHPEDPEICCSKFVHQFHVTEKTPSYGISCCERSEFIAHEVSEDLTQEPSYGGSGEGLQSTDASSFIQQGSVERSGKNGISEPCNLPLPIADKYVFPSTTEEYELISMDGEDSLSSSSGEQSKGRETQLVSDDFVEKLRLGVQFDPGSESIAYGVSKDLTREPSYDTVSGKGLQSTDATSLIQQSSLERSARNDVSEPCKFPLPIDEYALIWLDCENMLFSSSGEKSKSRESRLASNDLLEKMRSGVPFDPGLIHNPVSCIDDLESFPIELLLPDEDSLITADDFKFTPEKDNNTIEGSPVKADGVNSSSPFAISTNLTGLNIFKDEKSTQRSSEDSTSFCNSYNVVTGLGTYSNSQELQAYRSPATFHRVRTIQSRQTKQTSFCPLDSHPAQARKASVPSHHPFSTNILPSTVHHSLAKQHQQLLQMHVPGRIPQHQLSGCPGGAMTHCPCDQSRYLQEFGPTQDFPLNYQPPSHGSFEMPGLGFRVYGSTDDLTFNTPLQETQRKAGTGFYLGRPYSDNL